MGEENIIHLNIINSTKTDAQIMKEGLDTAHEIVAAENVLLKKQNQEKDIHIAHLEQKISDLKKLLDSIQSTKFTVPRLATLPTETDKLEIFKLYVDGWHLQALEEKFKINRRIIEKMAKDEGWKSLRQQVRNRKQNRARMEANIDVNRRVTQKLISNINEEDYSQGLLFDVSKYLTFSTNVMPFRKHNLSIDRRLYKTNKTGFRGVVQRGKKYVAFIWVENAGLFTEKTKQLYLGSFDTAEEAALRYDEAAKMFFGKSAILNFPNRTD